MKKYLPVVLRVVIAVILIQTLRFKFTGHPDSIHIFSQVGMEPYGRIIVGIVELIAGVLILIPATVWLGAVLAIGVLSGAILMHLTILGIDVNGDGGLLFFTAVFTWLLSLIVLYSHRQGIPFLKLK